MGDGELISRFKPYTNFRQPLLYLVHDAHHVLQPWDRIGVDMEALPSAE